jgi:hypothetical protein
MATVNAASEYNSGFITPQPIFLQITTSANVALSGAEEMKIGALVYSYSGTSELNYPVMLWGRHAPASVAAQTYKLRFRINNANATGTLRNNVTTGQLYAFEVAE